MTLEMEEKKALSEIRMTKALEFLEDAKVTFSSGRYRTSVNRSYYAALNAIRALLILEGSNPVSHEGIVTMLSLKFIKPGLVPVDVIKKFKTLMVRRTDVDYGDFDTIDTSEAEDSLRTTEELIKVIDKVRKGLESSG